MKLTDSRLFLDQVSLLNENTSVVVRSIHSHHNGFVLNNVCTLRMACLLHMFSLSQV